MAEIDGIGRFIQREIPIHDWIWDDLIELAGLHPDHRGVEVLSARTEILNRLTNKPHLSRNHDALVQLAAIVREQKNIPPPSGNIILFDGSNPELRGANFANRVLVSLGFGELRVVSFSAPRGETEASPEDPNAAS